MFVIRTSGGLSRDRQGCTLSASNVSKEMGENALGEAVGLNPVLDGHLPQPGREVPVLADDVLDEALVRKVVESAILATTLTRRQDRRTVLGAAGPDEPGLRR